MQENKKQENLDETNIVEQYFVLRDELKLLILLIKNKIILIFIAGLLGASLGFIYAYIDKPVYNAKISFLASQSSSANNLSSQLSGLAGMFGVGGSTIGSSVDRMTELISTDKIITRALFKSVKINDSEDFLINHFIKLQELDKSWNKGKDSLMYNMSFESNIDNINELTFSQRKALKVIRNMILPSNASINSIVSKYSDKKTGIVYVNASYINETFAIEIVNSIYDQILFFYTQESSFNAQNKIDALSKKVDSIKQELDIVQKLAGSTADKTLGLLLNEDKVDLKNLKIQEQILIIMVGESMKNLETFRVLKDTENPPLTLLDFPYSPIEPLQKNIIYFILFGFLVTSFLVLLFFRLQLKFNEIFNEYSIENKKS